MLRYVQWFKYLCLCISGRQCFPQRAALLKSMLNFLKKAIPEPTFSESMRHCKCYIYSAILHIFLIDSMTYKVIHIYSVLIFFSSNIPQNSSKNTIFLVSVTVKSCAAFMCTG